MSDLLKSAKTAVDLAKKSGAQDAWGAVSRDRSVSFTYRDGKVEKGTVVGSGGVGPGGGREVLLRQDGGGVKDDGSEVTSRCAAWAGRPCKEWRYGGREVTMDLLEETGIHDK